MLVVGGLCGIVGECCLNYCVISIEQKYLNYSCSMVDSFIYIFDEFTLSKKFCAVGVLGLYIYYFLFLMLCLLGICFVAVLFP